MINKDKVKELVKSYLPQAEAETVESIAYDIIRDTESYIYSMLRQVAAQERENMYWKNRWS